MIHWIKQERPNLPSTPQDFVEFMKLVWEPLDWALYDKYSNAIDTARLCGMSRTGGTKVHGEDWHVYRFAEGPGAVQISPDGNGVNLSTHKRFKRK